MPLKIFISHSAADQALASALVDCILASMVLDDVELRCTSVPGHKLPGGCDFAATLLQDIGDSSVVIGLITKNAIASSWVLFELGATWGANKNLKPLVTDEVDLRNLPGPVSGKHVARMSSQSDVAQFIEEVIVLVKASSRSAAKTGMAIERLLTEHNKHIAAQSDKIKTTKTKIEKTEQVFAGVPFSELIKILSAEMIEIPARLSGGKGVVSMSLCDLFIANAPGLSAGFQSNSEADSGGDFLYRNVGLKLITYGLTKFEKLPAAQAKWFKRVIISDEGHRFLLQCKRLVANSQ